MEGGRGGQATGEADDQRRVELPGRGGRAYRGRHDRGPPGGLPGGRLRLDRVQDGRHTGHYFWGRFDPEEHTAADNLKWLREAIDAHVTFWRMAPDESIFGNLDPAFRGLAWPGHKYVLGTDQGLAGMDADLPPGKWTVRRYDVMAREATTLSEAAEGKFTFDAPDSRAVLFHFKRQGEE